jgi:hypothetical protein
VKFFKKSVVFYIFREIFVNFVGYKLGLRKLRSKGRVNNMTWNTKEDIKDKGVKHSEYVNNILDRFDKSGKIKKDVFLEMGPGGTVLPGFYHIANGWNKYIGVDVFPSKVWSSYPLKLYNSAFETMANDKCDLAKINLKSSKEGKGPVYYLGNDGIFSKEASLLIGDSKVDMIYSYGVLEHIPEPREVFKHNFNMLQDDGIVVHVIDPYPHTWLKFDNPYYFLTIPDWLWNLMYGGRGFINRYRYSSYIEWATEAGFKILDVETELADKKYMSIKDKFISKFKHLEDSDILTDRLCLVLKKG